MLRLLICSPDSKLRPVLAGTLGADFRVRVESDPASVQQIVGSGGCDVLILDFDSRNGTVEEQTSVFDLVRGSSVPIVVMADDERRAAAYELLTRGVYDYFRKPPNLAELKVVVRRAHENAVLRRELESARQIRLAERSCDSMVGCSARMNVVYDLVRKVANLNAHVLITGESGTGKELVARAVHNLSDRCGQPFVAVSCGAIPETLIEAELFGHEKGAFTGSGGMREGYMEQAGAGTLFLDEIGELSPLTQVKLLRVLQQREFCRLGSSRPVPLKARILFATHRDLSEMVSQGTFRQDLYYRVNVMRINVPALRDRTEDIPALASHFLTQYCELYNKPLVGIEPDAMTLLLEHDWPGNVRELENVIQGAIIMAEADQIGVDDLPQELQRPDALGVGASLPSGSFEQQLHDYKIKLANKAIADCSGNKTLAARSLSISRAYLHRLIRESERVDAA